MKLLGEDIRSEELLAEAKGIPYPFYASSAEPLTYEYLMKIAARRRYHKLREKFNTGTLGYAGSHGSEDLRKEIAKLYGPTIGFDNIVIFPGAQTGMTSTALALLAKKDHSIIITPSYQSLEYGPKFAGSDFTRVVLSPDNGWVLDIKVLERAIQINTKYIVINEPQNPSGSLMAKDTQKKLVELAEKHHIYIFSDEVYRFLEHNPADRLPSIADLYVQGIALGTMSKAWGAGGMCVGWVVCQNTAVIKKLHRAQYPFTVSVSRTAEIEAMIALRARKEIVAKNIKIIKKNLCLLDAFFAENKDLFEWRRPVAGCTAFVEFKGPMSGDAFAKALLNHGILVFPPYIFDCSDGTLGQYFRIGYSRTNMPVALEAFKKFIEAHRAQWHCIRKLPALEASPIEPPKIALSDPEQEIKDAHIKICR